MADQQLGTGAAAMFLMLLVTLYALSGWRNAEKLLSEVQEDYDEVAIIATQQAAIISELHGKAAVPQTAFEKMYGVESLN